MKKADGSLAVTKHWYMKKFRYEWVKNMDCRQAAECELIEDVMDKYLKWDADRKRRG